MTPADFLLNYMFLLSSVLETKTSHKKYIFSPRVKYALLKNTYLSVPLLTKTFSGCKENEVCVLTVLL